MNLSPAQLRHLDTLYHAGAKSERKAVSACDVGLFDSRLHAPTLAFLEAGGFTGSKVRQLGRGSRATIYWLTRKGRERARATALRTAAKSGFKGGGHGSQVC